MSAPHAVIGGRPGEFQAIVESLPDALFVESGGAVVCANRKFCELAGRDLAELLGAPLRDILAPEGRAAMLGLIQRAAAGEGASAEGGFVRPDGTVIHADLRATPVLFNDVPAVACVARDLSERQAFQARLMLSDRMASVGTLAAGVAHEINNPLAFVVINLAYVSEQLDRLAGKDPATALRDLQTPEILEAISEAQAGSQRVRRIVQDLRSFARTDDEKREPVLLSQVIETCLSMAWNEIRHRAQLERDFEPLPAIMANRARLSHAFLNLIVNAAQAIPAGSAEKNRIRVSIKRIGANARVVISDTGHGIEPGVLPRIFDPFFTTKPVGVGTGLGLSVVHGTVTAMGGTVTVESEVGKGTSFAVELPMPPVPVPAAAALPAAPPPARRGRVLVIDDEASVGTSLRRGLRSHHDVDFVVSAAGALEVLASARDPYDVVLCDLMMPDMSGMELYDELRKRHPGTTDRLVFFTGGAFVNEAQAFLDRIPNPRVEKPLDLNQVKNLIQEMLVKHGLAPSS